MILKLLEEIFDPGSHNYGAALDSCPRGLAEVANRGDGECGCGCDYILITFLPQIETSVQLFAFLAH